MGGPSFSVGNTSSKGPFSIFAMPAYPRASVGFNFHLRVAVTSIWRNKKGRATQRPTNQPSKNRGPIQLVTSSRHCGESRWLATPKRCRFVRSRDKPHGSGDRHRSFPGGILVLLGEPLALRHPYHQCHPYCLGWQKKTRAALSGRPFFGTSKTFQHLLRS